MAGPEPEPAAAAGGAHLGQIRAGGCPSVRCRAAAALLARAASARCAMM
jgi:hypothetical protein